ncbi:Probable trehalose-phosphate phosphatase I [Linum perenne]
MLTFSSKLLLCGLCTSKHLCYGYKTHSPPSSLLTQTIQSPNLSISQSLNLPISQLLTMANNLWVDSLRASLRTRSASTSTSFNLPNALHSFNEILKASKEKKIVMSLDYDGTLMPIVNNPDEAFMSPQMRVTVNRLSTSIQSL